MKTYILTKRGNLWVVTAEGATRATLKANTREEAIERFRERIGSKASEKHPVALHGEPQAPLLLFPEEEGEPVYNGFTPETLPDDPYKALLALKGLWHNHPIDPRKLREQSWGR